MRCDEGCGACCGVAPATETEYRRVERYIEEQGITPMAGGDELTCPFYQQGRCVVYPVRPLICKLFGHGELLACERGYNVNIPERDVDRMVGANGRPTRVLHELLPSASPESIAQWKEDLKGWGSGKDWSGRSP